MLLPSYQVCEPRGFRMLVMLLCRKIAWLVEQQCICELETSDAFTSYSSLQPNYFMIVTPQGVPRTA
jgi:hypothetical protein